MFKLITFIALTGLSTLKNEQFKGKVNWAGHWESYSFTEEGKVLGTIDITKSKDKSYIVEYMYTAEENKEGTSEPCGVQRFSFMAEYDGKLSLTSYYMGFVFDYDADTGLLFASANALEPMFGTPNCVSGFFTKVK